MSNPEFTEVSLFVFVYQFQSAEHKLLDKMFELMSYILSYICEVVTHISKNTEFSDSAVADNRINKQVQDKLL